MKASDVFVRCLENEQVDYVFTLPGEELQDLLFSLSDSKIKMIVTRHEQGAAFMADVYGRVTGKAGVCMSTLGPGATNLVTGVADANLDHAPLVAVTAQGSLARLHKESHQIISIIDMFRPITKWNTRITSPGVVPESVRKAFKVAEMEKPGATHLELPEDVAGMPGVGAPLRREKVRRAAPDHKALARAIEMINDSKKPLILAGNGAIRKLASNQLRSLVQKTKIPVLSTFMGKGAISDEREESMMSLGLGSPQEVFSVIDSADLIITVGYDVAELDPIKWNKAGKKIIHVDFYPAEVYSDYQPDVEVVADISNTLWSLNQEITRTFEFPEVVVYRAYLRSNVFDFCSDSYPIHPNRALLGLRRALGRNSIIVSDVGAHKMWVGSYFPTDDKTRTIISNGFASMGIALPGAIGAKLAAPDADVVAVSGDGGFLMNVQELETAKRYGVNFTNVIFNDKSYSLIESKFKAKEKRTVATDISNPDFELLARSFGCNYFTMKNAGELDSVYREALGTKGVNIVDVPIDKSKNEELFGK